MTHTIHGFEVHEDLIDNAVRVLKKYFCAVLTNEQCLVLLQQDTAKELVQDIVQCKSCSDTWTRDLLILELLTNIRLQLRWPSNCDTEQYSQDFKRAYFLALTKAGYGTTVKQRPTINGRLRPVIRAEDIKHKGRMTDEQIAEIPVDKVYEWVRIGAWKQRDFVKWLKTIRVIE